MLGGAEWGQMGPGRPRWGPGEARQRPVGPDDAWLGRMGPAGTRHAQVGPGWGQSGTSGIRLELDGARQVPKNSLKYRHLY